MILQPTVDLTPLLQSDWFVRVSVTFSSVALLQLDVCSVPRAQQRKQTRSHDAAVVGHDDLGSKQSFSMRFSSFRCSRGSDIAEFW